MTDIQLTRPSSCGYWYHFTAKENLPSILAEDLKPHGNRPANYHGKGLDSQSHLVYLTNRPLRPWHCMDYENTVALLILHDWLDPNLFTPDEDDPQCESNLTIAYEGVIDPDTIALVYGFERCLDEQGKYSHRMVTIAERHFGDPEYRLVFNLKPVPITGYL